MKITTQENRVFFDNDGISYGNVSIEKNFIKIELIRVLPEHRGRGFASKLLKQMMHYVQTNFKHIKKIFLSPMPIGTGSNEENKLDIYQLINFYKKHRFCNSSEKTREEPYLMVHYL